MGSSPQKGMNCAMKWEEKSKKNFIEVIEKAGKFDS